MNFQNTYLHYRSLVDECLRGIAEQSEPRYLYDPVQYILNSAGKRVRGTLVMFAAEAVGGSPDSAVDAGAAVEVMHAFTLVHDDIMDSAQTRRGLATVHTKWDQNTAILAGDVMVGLAMRSLMKTPTPNLIETVRALNTGLIEVCEGQALDKEYETRNDVSHDDYIHMITMKTGRLLETAAEIGGWIGGGTAEEIESLILYARHLGIAFQIQDDLLDITANEAEFGKLIGGDILEGKKTYLLVRALECSTNEEDAALLERFIERKGLSADGIPLMRSLYERYGILDDARAAVAEQTEHAKNALTHLAETPGRDALIRFAEMIMNRSN